MKIKYLLSPVTRNDDKVKRCDLAVSCAQLNQEFLHSLSRLITFEWQFLEVCTVPRVAAVTVTSHATDVS